MADIPPLKNTMTLKGISVLTQIKDFLMSNAVTVGMVLGVLVLLTVVGYLFSDYLNSKFNKNAGNMNKEQNKDTCEFIFFYTTWCPYCKKALPVWEEFSKQWNGKMKNGYEIIMTEVDCDQDEATANRFDVTGYPTIKCIMNGKSTDFDAKPSLTTLNQFLESCFSK